MRSSVRFAALFVGAMLSASFANQGLAASTGFTYQGALLNAMGEPADGNYDFEFELYDAAMDGNLLDTDSIGPVTVTDGIFTVEIDFGAAFFDGLSDLWLEIRVRESSSKGSHLILSPRQPITPTPLAINADQLDGMDSTAFLTSGATVKQLIEDFVVATGESVAAGDLVSFFNGEVRRDSHSVQVVVKY